MSTDLLKFIQDTAGSVAIAIGFIYYLIGKDKRDAIKGEQFTSDGDQVLYEDAKKRFTRQNFDSLKVSEAEIKKAYKKVSGDFIESIKQMIKNITAVHQAQLPKKKDTVVYPEKGISVWRKWRPIEKVGLYIPGGQSIYPSSVLVSAIPAEISDCKEIIICSPARGTAQIPAPTLVAADMIGIKQIFKLGGPLAIAAMTYGTKTVPKSL